MPCCWKLLPALKVAALLDLQSFDNPAPVIVQMALHQHDGTWEQAPQTYIQTTAALGADVVGINCCALAEARAFLDAAQECASVRDGQVQLAVMPNGGEFRRVGHRYLTGVNPECMGRFAREMAHKGAHLIGGCCEVHPPHIREMHNYLHGLAAGRERVALEPQPDRQPTDAAAKRRGPSRASSRGPIRVSVELLPPRGTGGLKARLAFVAELVASGLADALDITDGSRGIPLMPPGDFIHLIRRRLHCDRLELIPHCTSATSNRGGRTLHQHGPATTHRAIMRHDRDPRTHFTIGTGCEQKPLIASASLARKIDAGADYVMTQPTFDRKASGPDHLSRSGADHCGSHGAAGVGTRPAHCRGARGGCGDFCQANADPADQAKAGIEIGCRASASSAGVYLAF